MIAKQRPKSNSAQSITIRSYLGRFLNQSKQNFGLNPIVTSAVTAERPNQVQPTRSSQSFSNQHIERRHGLPFAMNYSALHRPKLNGRNPAIGTRPYNGSIIEQEIRALTREIDVDNAMLQRYEKRDKQSLGDDPDHVGVESRFSNPDIFGPPHGTFLPTQAYANIARFSKPEQSIGLSIISTPAPVQYKDETAAKASIGSVCSGSLDVNGACRYVINDIVSLDHNSIELMDFRKVLFVSACILPYNEMLDLNLPVSHTHFPLQ